MDTLRPNATDALVIVDVQNDFLPGGTLAVPGGDAVIPVLNSYIALFTRLSLPIFATRDWHPANHCSFKPQGGMWPPHCIAGSSGAAFPAALHLPDAAVILSKATTPQEDAYSGFQRTALASLLRSRGVERLLVGGLATDYCVLNTVLDGLKQGFRVVLLLDAIRAVELHAGDGGKAIAEMTGAGAVAARRQQIDDGEPA